VNHFHIVASNEELSGVAQMYGIPVAVLKRINNVPNRGYLPIGTKIYLREEDVLGVQVMFLDVDRNPICNQEYFLDFGGRIVKGKTVKNGLTTKIFTDHPDDVVKISIVRLDGTLKLIATVKSGYRNKLVTIVTPKYRADAIAQPDAGVGPGTGAQFKETNKPIYAPMLLRPATTDKKDLGPTVTPLKTADGRPLAKVEGDIPDLDLILGEYSEKDICDADIKAASDELKCEPGLIYAIARQESSVSSFFKIHNRTVPKILFERHWFLKLTKPNKNSPSPYESKYPDICGPAYHLAKRNKKKELIDNVTGEIAVANDIYGSEGFSQYKRLLKAYQLDPEAALKSCSWGKFQIMGFNFKAAGFNNVRAFVKAISRNDVEHIKAFLKFAKSNSVLLSGLRGMDFEMIAQGHNGGEWRVINPHYARNLKKYYEEYLSGHDNEN
jgi:LysM repeat protein